VVFKPEDAAPAPAAAPAAKAPGQAEKYDVNVNGTNYAVVVSPAGTVAAVASGAAPAASEPSAAASGGGAVIPAPVAGTVLRYTVGEGDEVQKGATVIIIESMKMELEIKSTAAGKIHFLVPTGTQVAAQQPVAEIGGGAAPVAAAPAPAPEAPAAAPAAAAPSGSGVAGGVVVPAPVAGTVLRYAVSEGEQVAAGATIIIIESMKMELEIKSTASGKIHFLVPTGTQVAAQQPVAEIGGGAPVAAPPAPAAAPAPVVEISSGGGTAVLAPVAGTLLRYAVSEGDQVASGATIVIIESMKMELEIKATAAGKVHFLVPAGTQVASQQPIAEIC
jgi:oxaloacetate decarboxylase alpha subunit